MITKQSFLTFHDHQEVQATLQSASTMHSQNKELQCYRGWKMQSQMQLGNSNSTAFWYLSSCMATKAATERWAGHLCLPALGCRSHSGAGAHAVQQLHSCLLLHLNLVQRDSDLEAVWNSSYGHSVGSAGLECPYLWRAAGSLTWEDVERWAVTTGTTGGKNWHEGETLITWEMLFCLSNEQNQYCRGFIKFVFDENLCSDETVIPTGCFTIIFLTASKACVWRCMESKY